MLNPVSLLKLLKRPRYKNWIYDLAMEVSYKGFVLTDLLNLTLHQDTQTAFHAVWLLDTIIAFEPSNFAGNLPLFLNYARQNKNPSCKRHYARIFMYCTKDQDFVASFAITDLEPMVELCFDWLIDPKIKIAVKVCASETLCNLRYSYPWIAEELQNQLRYLMQNGSPAIQTTGCRLLSTLQH
ncbi:hypothetical protein ACFQ3S_08635 [Mucilaginibacter terrae]|uniref:hypothetical protein n=1 Tax=Mucilaginibacter terrae TaxID=1955052 RepID=UPI00362770AE